MLFENWAISELLKSRYHRAKDNNLYFWRNNTGLEIDVVALVAGSLRPIEIKSGMTISSDWFEGLKKWCALAKDRALEPLLVYGGEKPQSRAAAQVLPWASIDEVNVERWGR